MKRRRYAATVLLSLLVGCLLLSDPPPRCPDDCAGFGCDAVGACLTSCAYSTPCADAWVCDDTSTCVPQCWVDDDCQDAWVCVHPECQAPCQDDDCDHGLACDDYANACDDRCYLDSDCREGWECCSGADSTGCDYGTCVRG